jgi:hypothetical protein
MPRASTGSIKWMRNVKTGKPQWHARFSKGNGKRTKYIAIAAGIPQHDRAGALADAARWAPKARVTAPDGTETVAGYSGRWLDDRDGRVNSIRDDRSRMRDHVLPTLATLNVATFTRDDVERLRDKLDDKITKGELAWKTASSCWALVTSMCADMVTAKKREFRVRDDNPCRDVKPPERGAKKQKQYLWPSEFMTFVRCDDVPLRWRRAVALAIYTYTRDAELRVLRWQDVNEAGLLNITRAYNRRNPKEVKGTKTDTPRRFAAEATLLPLLEAMRKDAGDAGLVVKLPSERAMARNLRRWLWKANVRQAELHENTSTSIQLTWHDPPSDRDHVVRRPRRRPPQDQTPGGPQLALHDGDLRPGGRGHPRRLRRALPSPPAPGAPREGRRGWWRWPAEGPGSIATESPFAIAAR